MSAAPLRVVLDAIAAGDGSLAEIGRRTGLRVDVVTAAVEHLVRMGRLAATPLATGCPSGGCGTCPSGAGDGPGCGTVAARRAPVLVQLTAPGSRNGPVSPAR